MNRKIKNKRKMNISDANNKGHFYNLFVNAPVALLEIDYSPMHHYLKTKRTDFGMKPEQYFLDNPQICKKILKLRIVKEANNKALELFKVANIQQLRKTLVNSYINTNLNKAATLFTHILENKKLFNYETEIIDALGKPHTANVRFSTNTEDYSKAFISFFDISEIKQKQDDLKANKEKIAEDLRLSEARYRQLTSLYPIGIFHSDKNGQTIYTNNKAQELQGIVLPANKTYDWMENLHIEDRDQVIRAWRHAVQYGIPINLEFRFSKHKRITWVNLQTVPEYNQDGKIIGFISILIDNTKKREVEAQIKENQIKIAHFSRLNSMGEVASGISHELNQPLTAIINYINGCKHRLQKFKTIIPQEIFEAIDNATIQAERAGKIIHHLKDFLRKGQLNKQGFDLNTTIKEVVTFIDKFIVQNQIKIELQFDHALPVIHADKIHIEQVILNIINNAIEAFIGAKTDDRNIMISTTRYRANFIKIDIQDNGPGINTTIVDNIFYPFVTTKEQGMGIGLSLCYNIINKHGGRIDVYSKVDKGTSFSIILPLK